MKLIDFGIATELPPDGILYEVVGSRTYMAPEIDQRIGYGTIFLLYLSLSQVQGKPVDLYAIGVIMYILLCGYPPFDYDQGCSFLFLVFPYLRDL